MYSKYLRTAFAVLTLLGTGWFGAATSVSAQGADADELYELHIRANTGEGGTTFGAQFTVTTEDGELLGGCTLEGDASSPPWQYCRVNVPKGIVVIATEDLSTIPAGYAPVENPIAFDTTHPTTTPHQIDVFFDNEPQSGTADASQTSQIASDSATTPFPAHEGTSGPSHEAKVWEQRFGSSGPDHTGTEALGIGATSRGVYVVGSVPAALPGETYQGGDRDGYVQTYDSKGNELWGHEMGTRGLDDANAVAVDDSGVYVAGTVSQYLDGPGNDALPGQTYLGEGDAFVRKYDLNGKEIWTRQFGTPDRDQVFAIAVRDDAVYVTGSTDAAFPGETHVNGDDVFVSKFDLDGNAVWTQEFGTDGADQGQTIAVDSAGVYVAGTVWGAALPGQKLVGDMDVFIRKYDLDGHELWTDEFGSNTAYAEPLAVTADSSGVYIGGWHPVGTETVDLLEVSNDAFIRKYNRQGTLQWSHQFGSDTPVKVKNISVDASGIYASGTTEGPLPGQTQQGVEDVFVRKYDSDGNELWTHQYGETEWAEDMITYTIPGITYASGRVDNTGDGYFDDVIVAQLTP